MSNPNCCVSCGSPLPKTAPASQKSVACEYCDQMNPNPNFVSANPPLSKPGADKLASPASSAGSADEQTGQTIDLAMSSVANLYSGTTFLAGIALFVYFCFHGQSMWIYLLCSIFMALPLFAKYFVQASWENVAKAQTVKSHEKYTVVYKMGDYESYAYITSFVYFIWFAYLFFTSFIPITGTNEINATLCGVFAFFLSFGGIWFIDMVIKIIAEALGKWLPQE